MSQKEISRSWQRIEQWLAANAPEALKYLPAGADSKALEKARTTLGYAIPSDLAAFLSVHDGSGNLWLHDLGAFMSVKAILHAWDNETDLWGDGDNDEWAKPRGRIRKNWWNRKWVPFLDARTEDYACIDLAPVEGGKRGQVISWLHTGGPQKVVVPSFAELIRQFAQALDAGLYVSKVNKAGQPYLDRLTRKK